MAVHQYTFVREQWITLSQEQLHYIDLTGDNGGDGNGDAGGDPDGVVVIPGGDAGGDASLPVTSHHNAGADDGN